MYKSAFMCALHGVEPFGGAHFMVCKCDCRFIGTKQAQKNFQLLPIPQTTVKICHHQELEGKAIQDREEEKEKGFV